MGLADRADERVENYSSGMRQRLSLARALLHDPPVLFFDEPTTGLDVHSARALRELVRHLATEGRTVLLTTHNLQEAEELCSRVGIIHGGGLVTVDTPEGLRRRSRGLDVVSVVCTGSGEESPSDAVLPWPGLRVKVGQVEGAWQLQLSGPGAADLVPTVLELLMRAGWRLQDCQVKRPSLEDVFVELTGGGVSSSCRP